MNIIFVHPGFYPDQVIDVPQEINTWKNRRPEENLKYRVEYIPASMPLIHALKYGDIYGVSAENNDDKIRRCAEYLVYQLTDPAAYDIDFMLIGWSSVLSYMMHSKDKPFSVCIRENSYELLKQRHRPGDETIVKNGIVIKNGQPLMDGIIEHYKGGNV